MRQKSFASDEDKELVGYMVVAKMPGPLCSSLLEFRFMSRTGDDDDRWIGMDKHE